MKVNLIYGTGEILGNHLNLNPFCPEESDNLKRSDIKNLDSLIDNGELESLVANHILGYIPHNEIETVLQNWVSKLQMGGSIIVGEIDMRLIAKAIATYTLDYSDAQKLIYGTQDKPYKIRRSGTTLLAVENMLKNLGLTILRKQYNRFEFFVEAQR